MPAKTSEQPDETASLLGQSEKFDKSVSVMCLGVFIDVPAKVGNYDA